MTQQSYCGEAVNRTSCELLSLYHTWNESSTGKFVQGTPISEYSWWTRKETSLYLLSTILKSSIYNTSAHYNNIYLPIHSHNIHPLTAIPTSILNKFFPQWMSLNLLSNCRVIFLSPVPHNLSIYNDLIDSLYSILRKSTNLKSTLFLSSNRLFTILKSIMYYLQNLTSFHLQWCTTLYKIWLHFICKYIHSVFNNHHGWI